MEGGGLFTIIGMLVVAPLCMWIAGAQKFRLLTAQEQNLTRAANGFALAMFPVRASPFYTASLG